MNCSAMSIIKRASIAIFTIFLSSCSSMFVELYGIDHIVRDLSPQKVKKEALKLNLDKNELYYMDTSFVEYLNKVDTNLRLFEKNNYQPLQYKVFNAQGVMVSHLVNCDAGGFPNLNWNWMFNQFPPTAIDNKFADLLQFEEYSRYFLPMFSGKQLINSADYKVVVIWSGFMGRQNKRFLRKVKDVRSSHENLAVEYYFVNFDNALFRL